MACSGSASEKRRRSNPRQSTQHLEESNKLHREQQRRAFLHKVRQKREDRKWDVRGEQVLREDFLEFERRWIESQDRSAPAPLLYSEDDEMKESNPTDEKAGELIDQVLSQEHEEVDALVFLSGECTEGGGLEVDERVDHGSDDEDYDEDYDSIFMALLSKDPQSILQPPNVERVCTEANNETRTSEAMDTTRG
ncbi:MAG: hypothetical protein Q9166_003555 [cf. Caloplaca sp. 2 TL-2023]